jgi:hypothetical protein
MDGAYVLDTATNTVISTISEVSGPDGTKV